MNFYCHVTTWLFSIPPVTLRRIFMRIQIVFIFLFVLILQLQADELKAQRLSLSARQTSLEDVLKQFKTQTSYDFLYNPDLVEKYGLPVTLDNKNMDVEEALVKIFQNQPYLSYVIDQKTVIIRPKKETSNSTLIIQLIEVKGKITDDKGDPLPGATVGIKGTTSGVVTDINGMFTLKAVNPQSILVITYTGFTTEEIQINGRTQLVIVLKQDIQTLKELVVVGYGTQKKVNVTGSVETVSSKMLENRPATDVSNLLTGQVPGLTVIQNSGQPGRDQGTIRIRGIGTLGSGNDPLIIVDGVESTMFNVDPNDIDNISVLKDASASAIYGVRAANGVIIISTKRGLAGKTNITYNGYTGFQQATRLPKFLGSVDYALLLNEAIINDGGIARYTEEEIEKFRNASDPVNYPNSDWVNGLFSESGLQQNHHLGLRGGTEVSKYALSFGFLNRGGLIPNTSSDRYALRANFDQDFSKKFKISLNLSGTRVETDDPSISVFDLVHRAYREPPVVPIQYAPGIWGAYMNEHNSIAQAKEGGYRKEINNKFISTLSGQYEIIKGIKLRGLAGVTNQWTNLNTQAKTLNLYNAYDDVLQTYPVARSFRSFFSADRSETLELNLQSFLDYEHTFNSVHNLKVLLGYNQISTKTNWIGANIFDLISNDLDQLDAGNADTETNYGSAIDYSLRSYFTRLNYNFKEKYLLEFNLRYDGTSRFPATNRWGWFPSFSAGWKISDETFFPEFNWLDNLKFRGSWGQLGNQEIGNYGFISTYVPGVNYSFGGQLVPGIAEKGTLPGTSLFNRRIRWETTSITNIGFDAEFFKGKLSLTGEYFVRNTDDILLPIDQPFILGVFGNPTVNAGAVSNEGFEFVARHQNKIGVVNYFVNGNFSYVRNEITDLGGRDGPGRAIGDPIQNIYGYVADGLFNSQEEVYNYPSQAVLGSAAPGDIRYKDLNGDYLIDAKDRKSLGSYFPKINYGLQMGVIYKNFDASIAAQGVGEVYNLLSGQATHPFVNGAKALDMHLNRWTPENLNAAYPRLSLATASRNTVPNSFFLQNASYLRIRNLQVGYTLPKGVLKQLKLERFRLYFSADNPLLITSFEGFDPEAPLGDGNYYPQVMTITGGLNINF
ncbi:TonB-dependent receptor [Pedobacter aquae]|uniref:TonB-dependent receptor n=2 Tax=Pedobacter aquae TaxID=2605747 RepID=A0A5C0VJ86_9SPHI|nr:TonB-dependent receptor [Pedobacter aquae]